LNSLNQSIDGMDRFGYYVTDSNHLSIQWLECIGWFGLIGLDGLDAKQPIQPNQTHQSNQSNLSIC
jgi:hypothetical protein